MGIPIPWAVESDWMLGRDKHNELCIPPWPPSASPMHKHYVFARLKWKSNEGQWSAGREIYIQNRRYVKHFHNIDSWVIHVPIPIPGWVLLVVIMPLSSSKVALGSFSTMAYEQPVGLVGPTLNCATGFPRISGAVIPTRLPTVFVGVSFADLLFSAFYVGFDMLLSWALNKLFDRFFKAFMKKIGDKVSKFVHDQAENALFRLLLSPKISDATVNKILSSKLGDAVEKIFSAEGREGVNLLISQLATDVTKKYFGKAGKAGVDLLKKQVTNWYGRTNPGMKEKYIRVFEQEAPAVLAASVYAQHATLLKASLAELTPADYPGVDLQELASDPSLQPPQEEFVSSYTDSCGQSLLESTRGLLSSEEWHAFLIHEK